MCMKNHIELLDDYKTSVDKRSQRRDSNSGSSDDALDSIDDRINKKYLKYMNRKVLGSKSADDKAQLMRNADFLAICTNYTKRLFDYANVLIGNIKYSNFYSTITRTTQPAHFLAAIITVIVCYVLWPSLMVKSKETMGISKTSSSGSINTFFYLITFATHFGTQIWMTFVSGLALYFSLPRHIFGQCQQILFPKYYALSSLLSICTLITFAKAIDGNWNFTAYFHVTVLILRAAMELAVRLYLVPILSRLMNIKYRIEERVGSGTEVGYLNPKILSQCPEYQRINKGFRRAHGMAAASNMTILVFTFVHLHFLAHKIAPF